tara:strand:+ start:5031 stop:7610 length:2580 start_codon:yes stop_codon:yes gene_type:complete
MQASRTLFALLLITLSFSTITQAQLVEDFDTGDKSGYPGGSVTLSTGDWYFEEALLGNLTNDKCNGTQCVRMDRRDGVDTEIYMLFDKADGADEISFSIANYGNTSGNGVQVQYSTDAGSSWENLGDPIQATSSLVQSVLSVQKSGAIRFKFVQSGSERLNLDDLTITDFVEAQDSATLAVTVDALGTEDNAVVTFPKTLIGTTITKTIQLKNIGNTVLSISDISLEGSAFSLTELNDDSLEFNESVNLTLTFEPADVGVAQGSVSITSNDSNGPNFMLSLSGEAFEDGDIISISEARTLPLGTRVSVAGRVTVANELGGPLYLQDGTAGLAVFWEPLHLASQIGDSISVTGPLTVFKGGVPGPDSDFLLQISGSESDNILFEVFDVETKPVIPTPVNLSQLNSGNYEGQLVIVQNATINHTGAFGSNQNYEISDNSDAAELRIDNNTNLVNAIAPTGETNVVGAVGKFGGIYQLIPRFTSDLGVEAIVYPGDSVSKELTLDIVTWNIEWFGDAGNGPTDDNVQFDNAKTLITTMDADIYAFQEISNPSLFEALDDDLTEYTGILATFSQSQKTAFLYKNSTIEMLDSKLITTGMTQSDWANGRYPLLLHFNATINEETQEIYAYTIHAKAFGEPSDYSQRINASGQLKTYLDNNRADDNVIVLGDFNDEILQSTAGGIESPYKNFDDDTEYTIITKNLEEKGYTSYSRFSMIDHIIFTSELSDEYFVGTERIENPFYIGSFLSETSDHFPVWVRFNFGVQVSNETELEDVATEFRLDQNYPNPFNPSTTISYNLAENSNVSLAVYDLMGRKVATLVNSKQSAGEQSINFDASNLASGVYIYRLNTGNQLFTKKMILLK